MKMSEITYTNSDEGMDYLDCTILEHYVNVYDENGHIIELLSPHILPNGYTPEAVRTARRESAAFFRSHMHDLDLKEVP